METNKELEWDQSYINKDNFVFYPHEEIIRFLSKYVRKRVGPDEFLDITNIKNPKVLDFGCGIGRHLLLLNDFHLDAYGFDLSNQAISTAKELFKSLNQNHLVEKVIISDITDLPYEDNYFDFMLSHGVLDSMSYDIAKKGMAQLHKKLNKNGLVYLDLISTDDSSFIDESNLDRIVEDKHEKGTVQSYYDLTRIKDLVEGSFKILEISQINRVDILGRSKLISRFHIVLEKA